MIITQRNQDAHLSRIILTPNRSLTWRANLLFFTGLSVVSLAIALFFTVQGAYWVLVFSLLELIGVFYGLYYCVKRCYHQEVITFSCDDVWIEKGIVTPHQRYHYPRLWAKILIKPARHPFDGPSVYLRSHGQDIELGVFLSKQDKAQLIRQLNTIIYQWLPLHPDFSHPAS